MDNYKNLFIDIDNFNEENISYVKPIFFNRVSRSIGIYYKETSKNNITNSETNIKNKKSKDKTESDNILPNNKKREKKIIVRTPKMLVPFGIKEFDNHNNKTFQMSLSFSTFTDLYNEKEIKKFYSFIKRIDTVNEDTIMDLRKTWRLPNNLKYRKTLQRSSEDYPYYMNVCLPYDEKIGFLFNIYDENANKASIDIIEKKSIVSVVLELTDLKFSNSEFRSNWTVMQIRKFKPYSSIREFFMTGCFICDENETNNNILINQKNSGISPIKNGHLQTNITQDFLQKESSPEYGKNTMFKPPSIQELLEAKKSLRKTNTVIKGISCGKVIDKIIPPPPSNNLRKKKKKHIINNGMDNS
jgi:hypothetical protein